MDHIKKLQKTIETDYFIVPKSDEFQGEYIPADKEKLLWLTGFSGSAGSAIVTRTSCHLFVDSRYTLQAKEEAYAEINLHPLNTIYEWIQENIGENETLGLDPMLHTYAEVERFKKNVNLKILSENPIDKLWKDKPLVKPAPIYAHSEVFAGESVDSKINRVTQKMVADTLFVHDPHDVCWLLNIRGQDLPFTPIPLCRALVHKNKSVQLFVQDFILVPSLPNVDIFNLHELEDVLSTIRHPIQVDQAAPYAIVASMRKPKLFPCPIELMKASKNKAEIDGMIKSHKVDGLAVRKFLQWLEDVNYQTDEITAAEKLESFRKEHPDYICPSFSTISGAGPNGAIVHYHVTKKSNRKLGSNELYLCDSGGQYPYGTTDITRTICTGTPTGEQKLHYTLVLKGHIRLMTAVFPKGTTGAQLDALARYDLWQHGLNYGHGTGHGVGSFLSVHEGPQRISSATNTVTLEEGMVLSNEPGFYIEGSHGIRIENLMYVTNHSDGFLCFKNLTMVPYAESLIDKNLLTEQEKIYIESFHQTLQKI